MTVRPAWTIGRRDVLAGLLAASVAVPAFARGQRAARFPVRIKDMLVTDARSRARFMLMRDLVRDRVVVLNFMYTGCSTVCPMQSAVLSQTQTLLTREMGEAVLFASVSITPITDTPDQLVRFANDQNAGKGWHFLRGGLRETEVFQDGFSSLSPTVEGHPPVFCIGRSAAPQWTRLYGATTPRQIAREVRGWLAEA